MQQIDTAQLKKLIQQFPHYSDEAYNLALPFFQKMVIKKGVYFLKQGKVSRKIAFINSGLFRGYYIKDGIEITTCFCRENSFSTSYKSLITEQPSELSIQAIEDSEILVIQFDDLKKLYEKHLFWQQVGRLVAEQEFITMECYTRFLNDKTAKQRYIQIMEHESDLLQRVPLIYVASYLQVTPETVSRIRKEIATS